MQQGPMYAPVAQAPNNAAVAQNNNLAAAGMNPPYNPQHASPVPPPLPMGLQAFNGNNNNNRKAPQQHDDETQADGATTVQDSR